MNCRDGCFDMDRSLGMSGSRRGHYDGTRWIDVFLDVNDFLETLEFIERKIMGYEFVTTVIKYADVITHIDKWRLLWIRRWCRFDQMKWVERFLGFMLFAWDEECGLRDSWCWIRTIPRSCLHLRIEGVRDEIEVADLVLACEERRGSREREGFVSSLFCGFVFEAEESD